MTPNNYFPVRLRFILRSAKIVTAPFCIPSVLFCFILIPILLTFPFNFPQKKIPAKVDYNLYQDMGLRYEKKNVRKSSTFRQLPTNQPPDVCL